VATEAQVGRMGGGGAPALRGESGRSAPTSPQVRAVGTVDGGSSTIAPGLPSGTAVGDLLIMFVETTGGETPTASGLDRAPVVRVGRQWHGHERNETEHLLPRGHGSPIRTTTNDPGNHIMGRIVGITAGSWNNIEHLRRLHHEYADGHRLRVHLGHVEHGGECPGDGLHVR